MKAILYSEAEVSEPEDFDKISLYAREGVDHLNQDAIGYPNHWAAFTVAKKDGSNPTVVTVTPGRLLNADIVYATDAATDVDMMLYMPTLANNRRWIGLVAQGEERIVNEGRLIETDAETEQSVLMQVPKVIDRRVVIVPQPGNIEISENPTKPAVPAGEACIAFVLLGTTGVLDIVPGTEWRAETLYEVEGRVTALEVLLASIVVRVGTLETDLANLNATVNALPITRPEIIREMRRDIAAMRRQNQVPAGARSDFYDPALVLDIWDLAHALWQARIEEGIQFPFMQSREARLELVNEDNPLVRFSGRRMMPVWDEVKRIFNEGGTETRNISQQTHTVVTAKKRTVKRTVTEYGPTVGACRNMTEWADYIPEIQAGRSFTKDGEVWEFTGETRQVMDGDPNHIVYYVRTVKKKTVSTTYTDYTKLEVGVNGSIYGETFLVAQPMIATSVELDFSVVDPSGNGDVHVFLTQTNATGQPLFDKALANTTVNAGQLHRGWNKFTIEPTYLTPGFRYAWFTVTTGNHQLRGTGGNKFTGGTSFHATDGAWAQGDLQFDFNFRVNSARFINTRTVLDFQPMTLTGGMTQFRLLYPNWDPEGTAIEWEIRPAGAAVWRTLDPDLDTNPLNSLPELVELRCTLLATPDLAPMIELDQFAVYKAARVLGTMRAVTKVQALSFATSQIQTLTTLDDYDEALHTFSPRIIVSGNTLLAPDTSTVMVDPKKPDRRQVLSTYTVPAGTTAYRSAPGMTTTDITRVCFVENTAGFAL